MFATVFAFTSPAFYPALWSAVGVAVVILVVALVQRRSVQQTIGGFFGIALTAGIVIITGRARDFFLVGLWRNAFWLTALHGLADRPVAAHRAVPRAVHRRGPAVAQGPRAAARLHVVHCRCGCAVFGIRLGVQLPLFRGDEVVALGFAQVLLGLPLFLLACLATYLILRRVPITLRSAPDESDDEEQRRTRRRITPG